MIRKAIQEDIEHISRIYDAIHTEEAAGRSSVGWKKGVYPTKQTALDALARNDLFVKVADNIIVAAAIINQIQVAEYVDCRWRYPAEEDEIMVLHTLVVDPARQGRGYAKQFVGFYEQYAKEQGCKYLRMDTQVKNTVARNLYAGLGYHEAGVVASMFNGIVDVQLVCLEKRL